MPRSVTAVVLAAAVGVSACGGSSTHRSPTNTTDDALAGPVQPTTSAASSSAASVSTSTAAAHRHHARRSPAVAATATPTTASTAANSPGSTTAAAPPASSPTPTAPAPAATHSAPAPPIIPCLERAGLTSARAAGTRLWVGFDPASRAATVFVAGPYRSAHAAHMLATDRGRLGIAQEAGMYVAFASPPSNLDSQVHRVASCLGGAGPSYGTSKPRRSVTLKPPKKTTSGKGKSLEF